jgi:hypothetical protein
MLPITPTIIQVWWIGIFSSDIENLLLFMQFKKGCAFAFNEQCLWREKPEALFLP